MQTKQPTRGLISKTHKQLVQHSIKKKQTAQSKLGIRPTQAFLQGTHTDGQEAHEKMLNITNNQRNANQNYNEIPSHTDQWCLSKNLQQ